MNNKYHKEFQLVRSISFQNLMALVFVTLLIIVMNPNSKAISSFIRSDDGPNKGRAFYCIPEMATDVLVALEEIEMPESLVIQDVLEQHLIAKDDKISKKEETPFQPIIEKAAEQYQVEPAIIKAIIMAESSFNPKAVSYKGAQGLMQLMPRTAQYLGVKDSFDPEHNIKGGVKYFKRLLDRFDGDVKLALAAYNAGSRNVLRYNGVPPFKATKVYIKKVLQYYETYKADQAKTV